VKNLHWLAFLAFNVAACGGVERAIDDGDDAAEASPPMCDVAKPFTTIVALSSLNTDQNDEDMRLSPDELRATFGSDRASSPGDAMGFIATRQSTSDDFGTPTMLTVQSEAGVVEDVPTLLTADELTLYFWGCSNYVGFQAICLATRPTTNDAFELADPLTLPQSKTIEGDAFLSVDALHVVYIDVIIADAGRYAVVKESSRNSTTASFDVGAIVLDAPNASVEAPVISTDRKTLFVANAPVVKPHIEVATRASTDDAFTNLRAIPELYSTGGELATWVSPDLCRLYFTRFIGTETDLYLASKTP
jgi:hypothetical protein